MCNRHGQMRKKVNRDRRKEKVREKWNDFKTFVYNNKDLIIVVGPAILGVVTVTIKTVNKQVKLKKEKDLKELYCYDRSLGHYWRLKRELSNSEWIEIDKRKKNGERLGDILSELRVLK